MKRMSGIFFGISTSFMVLMLIVMIIRLSTGLEAYIGIGNILRFIESFEGYEVLKASIENMNEIINDSFAGWDTYEFLTGNAGEILESISNWFNILIKSISGVFELVIYGLKGVWDFVWYILRFVFDFMLFIVS